MGGVQNRQRRPHLQLPAQAKKLPYIPVRTWLTGGGCRGPGGGCGRVEAETEPKPHARRVRVCSPRRLGSRSGAIYPARLAVAPQSRTPRARRGSRSLPRWGCRLQRGGRAARSPVRHFPGSFGRGWDWLAVPSPLCAEVRLPLPPPSRELPPPPSSASTLHPIPVCREPGSEPSVCPSCGCGRQTSPRHLLPRWTAATPALRASGTWTSWARPSRPRGWRCPCPAGENAALPLLPPAFPSAGLIALGKRSAYPEALRGWEVVRGVGNTPVVGLESPPGRVTRSGEGKLEARSGLRDWDVLFSFWEML